MESVKFVTVAWSLFSNGKVAVNAVAFGSSLSLGMIETDTDFRNSFIPLELTKVPLKVGSAAAKSWRPL